LILCFLLIMFYVFNSIKVCQVKTGYQKTMKGYTIWQ
jgi:hypothetical protein